MIVDVEQRSLYRRHGTLTVGDAKLMQEDRRLDHTRRKADRRAAGQRS